MEKTWFIFQSDHHLGPFSTEEVREMLQNGKVDDEVPLWKEGVDDWYPLKEFQEFKPVETLIDPPSDLPDLPQLPDLPIVEDFALEEIIELPAVPELPSIPSEEVLLEVVAEESIEEELPDFPEIPFEIQEEEEALPEFPEIVEVVEIVEVAETISAIEPVIEAEPAPLFIPKPDSIDEEEAEEDIWLEIEAEVEKKPFNYKLITAVASCFIILILSGYLIYQSTQSYVNLEDFSAITIDRIGEVRKAPFVNNVQAEIFMSKDSKELILAANIKHKSKVYLTLTSVQDKVLAEEKVVATAMGMLINGVAKFPEVKIVKGDHFASGEYYVQLLAIPTGVEQRAFKYLYSKLSLGLLKPAEQLRFRGKSLIFPGTREDFDKNLSQFKKKNLIEKKKPYTHILEGYKTFSMLSTKIYKTYEDVLTSIRRGKEIESFEILYSKNIGPVLQGLILETHKQYKEFEVSDPIIARKFEELLEQGKRIGEMSSDMVTMTKKVNRLRKKNRERLMKLFIKRSLFLQETSKAKAHETGLELKNLKL
ncbi:GYF domain-containing protein [Halobacteriovorax sp. JY17]|uniref:DUF4339 domain-containing protein n=1 Tax=Halobacteriovorax sp. JY17 TaxID=2014617 RepID=UPI000C3B562F|nr:GYF domain-containing protein [Halobacteriovorax sp. JY17]PIK16115.1 MAG: hypothetical protein CES88_05115 [Halobacteriovorax sp. JY17]